MNAHTTRRSLLGAALACGSLPLRALVTGLPLAFVADLRAQTGGERTAARLRERRRSGRGARQLR